jgi:hypothetical protein
MSIFSACSLRNSVYCVDFLPVVVLLDLLQNIAHDQRGQMRQTVWALKDVAPFIKKLKITGVNTGIGNVVANKGGIIISMIYLMQQAQH